MFNYILLLTFISSYYIFIFYNNNIYIWDYQEDSKQSSNSSELYSSSEQSPNSGPEQDPDEDDFIKNTINNKNLITIKHKN